jgi:2-hydroxy-3-oxopropionate reductase
MSTIAPATARKVRSALLEKDADSLDAPVSGGEAGAKEGTLSIMVGGPEAAFQRALPVFEVLGQNIVHIGDASAGQIAKACNQIVVGLTIQAVAEALTLAKKAGVDPDRVRDALLGGFARSRILDVHGKRMIEQTYQPGFKVKLHRKDLGIALQTGQEVSLPLMTTSLVAELMNALIAQDKAELDHSALALLVGQMGGEG